MSFTKRCIIQKNQSLVHDKTIFDSNFFDIRGLLETLSLITKELKRNKKILNFVKLAYNLNFKDTLKQIQSTYITHHHSFLLFKLK